MAEVQGRRLAMVVSWPVTGFGRGRVRLTAPTLFHFSSAKQTAQRH